MQARHYGWQECTDNTLTNDVPMQEEEEEAIDTSSDHDMDTQAEEWAKSPEGESSDEPDCDGIDYTQNY